MGAPVAKVGTCCLCGTWGDLSFEHIPPRAAFNDHRVFEANVKKLIGTEWWDGSNSGVEGKWAQRGAGKETLCNRCNSNNRRLVWVSLRPMGSTRHAAADSLAWRDLAGISLFDLSVAGDQANCRHVLQRMRSELAYQISATRALRPASRGAALAVQIEGSSLHGPSDQVCWISPVRHVGRTELRRSATTPVF
jgi:hypothetical protein